MTLPSSGTITAAQINAELGRTATAYFNMGGSAERALAGRPSGQISFSNFYGKSNLPPASSLTSRGFEYSGWTSGLGNSPYADGILYDPSGSDPGLGTTRNIGYTAGNYICNFSASFEYYRQSAGSVLYYSVITDGSTVATMDTGTNEGYWYAMTRAANNIRINNTTTISMSCINGSGTGWMGAKNYTITITPVSK